MLNGLADALEARRGHRERADELLERLRAIELPRDAAWRWAAAGLLGEIRGAVRILRRLDQRDTEPTADPIPRAGTSGPHAGPHPGSRPGSPPEPRLRTWRSNVTAALLTLRANAGTSTEAGRHALRLAVVASIGEIVAQASGLPHGYWIVLTILIVLRPDYASTIYRGVQRAGGTVIGAGLGLATALLLHVGPAVLVAAVGVTMTIAYAVFAVNYLLFAVFLTDFVVTLMALLGQTAEQTVGARLAGTGIGAALALIGYLVWPSWEGESAQQKLARLYETQAHYAALVLRAYVRPGPDQGGPSLAELQRRAFRAAGAFGCRGVRGPAGRRAIPAADDRAARVRPDRHRAPDGPRLAHPAGRHRGGLTRPRPASPASPLAPGCWLMRTAAPARTVRTAGTGSGQRGQRPADTRGERGQRDSADSGTGEAAVAGAVDRFADGVEDAARVIAGSLRSLRPPGDMPPLREWQTAVYEQLLEPETEPVLAGPAEVLAGGTDEFADALDTAADILRRRLS